MISAKRLTILAATAVSIALIGLLDLPQTIRIKALVIDALPISHQTKHDIIQSLCWAASVGTAKPDDSVLNCQLANDSRMAANYNAYWDRVVQVMTQFKPAEPDLKVSMEPYTLGETLTKTTTSNNSASATTSNNSADDLQQEFEELQSELKQQRDLGARFGATGQGKP